MPLEPVNINFFFILNFFNISWNSNVKYINIIIFNKLFIIQQYSPKMQYPERNMERYPQDISPNDNNRRK